MILDKMVLSKEEDKTVFIVKLLLYSFVYGLFIINVIDLTTKGFWGYHLFLIACYFAPFVIVCLIIGFDDWELLMSLGLIASLMNDLFYAPIGMILFGRKYDLVEWYLWQLGFYGLDTKWWFDGGFFKIPVSSILMGLSIYARIIISYLTLLKWWRES